MGSNPKTISHQSPRRPAASDGHPNVPATAAIALSPTLEPDRGGLPAVELLTPNTLGVRHWSRLLGGLLYASSPRLSWSKLLRRTFDIGGDLSLDKGKTQQMSATVKYADGTSLDATKVSDLVWNIGNTGVATISKDGVVTGVSVGATTIKATYQGKESASHGLVVK